METLGSLVDKLTICNLKLWFVQDWVHQAQDQDADSFGSVGSAMVQSKLKDLTRLNGQRNKLMTEIDHTLAAAVRDGTVNIEERVKVGIPIHENCVRDE